MVYLALSLLALAICPVLAEVNTFELEENLIDFPVPAPAISLGWEASPGQHPWQLALRLVSPVGSVLGCGGVLVHPAWGITAAQCTAGRFTIIVRAGVTNLTTPEYISETTEFYNHPTYDSDRPTDAQPNDIAMIKLIRSVPITDLARPIRIQPAADAFREYGRERVITSGFGRLYTNGASVENLYWVYLTLVPNDLCQQIFNTFDDVVTDTSICAGPYNMTAQSVCYGDSGGPLVHTSEDEEPILVGITSFVFGGDAGCHSGYPGVFVRPGPFHEWFTEITGIDFDPIDPPSQTTSIYTTTTEQTTESPTFPTTIKDITTETESTTIQATTEYMTTESPATIPTTTEDPTTSAEVSEEESSEEEDPDLKEIMKRLEVEVNVKVKMNKFRKKKNVQHSH